MKIRIRTNMGSAKYPGMPWQYKEVHEVNETLGASLIADGVAELFTQPEAPRPAKAVAGVPDKPAIAEPKKSEISGKK